jgi:predicted short-subunit dehydrogenase-like oxidoreductase (DUF2520 family)
VLSAALARAGHRVVAVAAVSRESRRRAEELVPGAEVLAVDAVAAHAELLVIAVPDDDLGGLVSGLASTGAVRAGTLVAHTSGAHGIAVLAPLTERGALPMALHPAMTFTGTTVDLERLGTACFGVTTVEELRPAAEALVIEMGAEPVWVEEELRPLYHAALAQASDLLVQAGVEHPQRVLGPLLGAALDNALRHGDRALTGPVARGDAGTVSGHLVALGHAAPEAARAYVELSRLTALRAMAAGTLTPERAEALLDVLVARERP